MRLGLVIGGMVLAAFGPCGSLWAQESAEEAQQRLREVEQSIRLTEEARNAAAERAEQAALKAQQLSDDLVRVGVRLRRAEENVARIESRISELSAEENTLRQNLKNQEANLAQLLGIMERLKRRPAVTALMQPDDAITTARSVVLIRSVVPRINDKASDLRETLSALAKIEADLGLERYALSQSRSRLADRQTELARLVRQRRDEARSNQARADAESQRLQALTDEAGSLRELLDAVVTLAPAPRPEVTPPRPGDRPRSGPALADQFSKNRGQLSYPVVGTRILAFGQMDGVVSSRGTRLETAPGAQVYAPFDGEVVFAGAFRRFGLVLIIAHGDGYHSLMAGMDQIYGTEGDRVLTGEPIGTMGGPARATGASNRGSRPELYLELRHNGDAIDPAPWFRQQTAAAG